jgi:hypothetical protein
MQTWLTLLIPTGILVFIVWRYFAPKVKKEWDEETHQEELLRKQKEEERISRQKAEAEIDKEWLSRYTLPDESKQELKNR